MWRYNFSFSFPTFFDDFFNFFYVGFYPLMTIFTLVSISTPWFLAFSRGFVYTFGKRLKRGGDGHKWVRTRHILHHSLPITFSTYHMMISVWWWSLLMIVVPYVDVRSTYDDSHLMIFVAIPVVDFHLWWFPLMMFVRVYFAMIFIE